MDVPKSAAKTAWDLVYARVRPSLVRALTAATGTYDGVEAAIQAAFADALRRGPDDLRSVEGWLFATALDSLRSYQRRTGLLRRLGVGAPQRSELDLALGRADIVHALDSLARRDRELLIAKHYVGMTHEEIASYMHLSSGTVSASIGRAAARFQASDRRVSGSATAGRHDAIAHRLVTALDVLPVPAGPPALRPAVPRSRLRDPRTIAFAALLVVAVTVVATPQLRDGMEDLTRYTQRVLFGPVWLGYYIDLSALDAAGHPTRRLLFTSGALPGVPTKPDILGRSADHGPWSPDGEHMTLWNGSKIYLADRQGNAREIADFGPSFVVDRASWIGRDHVAGVLNGATGASWFYTVDVSTGVTDVRRLETPLPGRASAWFSPDRRWFLAVSGLGGCGVTTALYDLGTHRVVPILDADGRVLAGTGFLSDGRVVGAYCDRLGGRVDLYLGSPGTVSVRIASVPASATPPLVGRRAEAGPGSNEQIFVIAHPRPHHSSCLSLMRPDVRSALSDCRSSATTGSSARHHFPATGCSCLLWSTRCAAGRVEVPLRAAATSRRARASSTS